MVQVARTYVDARGVTQRVVIILDAQAERITVETADRVALTRVLAAAAQIFGVAPEGVWEAFRGQ